MTDKMPSDNRKLAASESLLKGVAAQRATTDVVSNLAGEELEELVEQERSMLASLPFIDENHEVDGEEFGRYVEEHSVEELEETGKEYLRESQNIIDQTEGFERALGGVDVDVDIDVDDLQDVVYQSVNQAFAEADIGGVTEGQIRAEVNQAFAEYESEIDERLDAVYEDLSAEHDEILGNQNDMRRGQEELKSNQETILDELESSPEPEGEPPEEPEGGDEGDEGYSLTRRDAILVGAATGGAAVGAYSGGFKGGFIGSLLGSWLGSSSESVSPQDNDGGGAGTGAPVKDPRADYLVTPPSECGVTEADVVQRLDGEYDSKDLFYEGEGDDLDVYVWDGEEINELGELGDVC